MDREHNEVLVMAVAGCTVYGNSSTNRQNPNLIAAIRSLDGGKTWQKPIDRSQNVTTSTEANMKSKEIKELFNKFEQIACEYEGVECWSARELAILLGYGKWENFQKVVDKAKEACENAGASLEDHFPDVRKMVFLGSGATREVDDYMLTRYACYLIAQNGDSRKPEISFAQNYFAVQTRVAEIVETRIHELERVQARAKLAQTEKLLSGVLFERGVDSKGFAVIRSKGDQALFNIDTNLLKRKFKIPAKRPLADFLPTVSIKAKDLAAEMTSVKTQAKNLFGQKKIEKEHVDNNRAVRKMLLDRGIIPENLPASEDVKKVERRLKKAVEVKSIRKK